MNKKHDQIFAKEREDIKPFEFNEAVAQVFDDMVSRSVPFYHEIHRLCVDLIMRSYQGLGNIIDLGCSTGTTIELISNELKKKNQHGHFIGVDTSAPMLKLAAEKCSQVENLVLKQEDMCATDFNNSEVVILNYTLQFLPLEKRLSLLKKIYEGLRPGGLVIISEKIYSPSSPMQDLITDLYYDFKKRNGYSELEIAQKREALENVLVPLSAKDQVHLMVNAGFEDSEMLFRWYNFASFLGQKHA